jgi:hypothetical protein
MLDDRVDAPQNREETSFIYTSISFPSSPNLREDKRLAADDLHFVKEHFCYHTGPDIPN